MTGWTGTDQPETAMAFIGKLLIVLQGALGIAVLAWAGGIYTHRIDWNTPPTQPGKDPSGPGLFDRQKAQADLYSGAVDKAYTRWSGNLSQVIALEGERYPRRTFYTGQLDVVKTGKLERDGRPGPGEGTGHRPEHGFLDINPTAVRKPVMVREMSAASPGVPADSIAGYDEKIKKLLEDITASQVKNAAAIVEREKLDKEIVVGMGQIKGLRTQLNEQKEIDDQANFENIYVDGFFTNREAEFGLLKKRPRRHAGPDEDELERNAPVTMHLRCRQWQRRGGVPDRRSEGVSWPALSKMSEMSSQKKILAGEVEQPETGSFRGSRERRIRPGRSRHRGIMVKSATLRGDAAAVAVDTPRLAGYSGRPSGVRRARGATGRHGRPGREEDDGHDRIRQAPGVHEPGVQRRHRGADRASSSPPAPTGRRPTRTPSRRPRRPRSLTRPRRPPTRTT